MQSTGWPATHDPPASTFQVLDYSPVPPRPAPLSDFVRNCIMVFQLMQCRSRTFAIKIGIELEELLSSESL
jgi:hypothetical protein